MPRAGFLVWLVCLVVGSPALAQRAPTPAPVTPGQSCRPLTQARADASAGTPNVRHDGTQLPGVPPPDISRGFAGIPRSAQPPLTASQRRILECSYHLVEANADMPYALFVPSTYDRRTPAPLIVDLHGLNITPLQQMLFDGTTDLAERYGFIVVAPMGYSVTAGWGRRVGPPVARGAVNPGNGQYSAGELSEIDAMSLLRLIAAFREARPNATPWDLWILIATDHPRGACSRELARRKTEQRGAPVFLYRFDWETPEGGGHMRSPHTVEIPFVFDNIAIAGPLISRMPEARALAGTVSAAWAAFARTGNPNTPALPAWAPYSGGARDTMLFNNVSRVVRDPDRVARLAMERQLKLS